MLKGLFAAALLAGLAGVAQAQEQEAPDYARYREGLFLRYLNAEPGGIGAVPRIGLSLNGSAPLRAELDSGSTGIVVAAEYIPGFDQLLAGAGEADLYELRAGDARPVGGDPGRAGRPRGRVCADRADAGARRHRGAVPRLCARVHADHEPAQHRHGRRRLRPRGGQAEPEHAGQEPAAAHHRRRGAAPAGLCALGRGRACRARHRPTPAASAI